MDDPRWLRLITIGLVLAALAVGYFLISGGFSARKVSNSQVEVAQIEGSPTSSPSPSSVLGQDTFMAPSPTPASAYSRIAERTKGGVETLPKTAFPTFLLGIISASAIIAGWGLRKFPH
ncbi:hypothetical protein HYT18_02590 [Candidatus Microgenomates bacterium]|nr:hypothetical protein [Candidatus Microgenomates bacterium]